MSNRRKPKNSMLIGKNAITEGRVQIPQLEKTVLKEVPANIRWELVESVDRDDVETVGRCVIYDDGSQDVIIDKENMSEEAKKLIYGGFAGFDHFSIADPEEN